MATQILARTGATPASARTIFNPSTPRSILKRPTPLPLSPSPFPFSAKFSAYISPSVKSPHVHFPPSPRLISTFTTHSPNTYDRAPISVSPNPLALPAWGDRVYSPTLDGFKLADPPKQDPFVFLRIESPRLTDFEDPRSPPPNPRARKSGNNIRFADLPNTPARDPTELGKALMRYPRSPYPSAPLSPVDFDPEVTEGFALREKATSRRTLSLDEKKSKRQRRTQSNSWTTPFTQIPSPLGRPNLSPVIEQRAGTRPSAQLNQAFWQSMSLHSAFASAKGALTARQPSTTSLSSSLFPDAESDVVPGSLRPEDTDAQPQFLFATRDGVLWSPGLPKGGRPGTTSSTSLSAISRSLVASPSPNDPTAAFPSFSAVFDTTTSDGGAVAPELAILLQYPPRVQVVDKHVRKGNGI
ncbi:hypothetical protein P691DRAFT_666310 [Macrolepiota fuliginosa MF-IS2]|uniref:Uncharacterized protein n=1 Tax=Macrolepiota fuliginosa MF-IS2 TaxID=1400762 RepID=A0A9P6C3E4_9AGAR|nr:hypothetical protein P691DRAFT_666310 [Macrolepiota fuliginosa MF-IS2]